MSDAKRKAVLLKKHWQYDRHVVEQFVCWSRDEVEIGSDDEGLGGYMVDAYFDDEWKYLGADKYGIQPVFEGDVEQLYRERHVGETRVKRAGARACGPVWGDAGKAVGGVTRGVPVMVKNGAMFGCGLIAVYAVLGMLAAMTMAIFGA